MEQIRSYMSGANVDQEEWDRIFGKKGEEDGDRLTMEDFEEQMAETLQKGKVLLSEEEWEKWFPTKELPPKPVFENKHEA